MNKIITHLKEIKSHLKKNHYVLVEDAADIIINCDKLTKVGSPEKANYYITTPNKEVIELINKTSELIINKKITDTEVRVFKKGCYTLQHYEEQFNGYEIIYFQGDDLKEEDRGEITYITQDIITIIPKARSLFIIKRNKDTSSFVKRITHHFKNKKIIHVRGIIKCE